MIIFPMAGQSRRFTEAGYGVPKYMLEAHGHSLFSYAVSSFKQVFGSEQFLFIYRDLSDTRDFLESECAALCIRDAKFLLLDAPTTGQAETVMIGLEKSGIDSTQSITIFNIDTFRIGWQPPASDLQDHDGYLEVFQGTGANWSFVSPAPGTSGLVSETAEKRAISDLCCTGLYYFKNAPLFDSAYSSPTPPVGQEEARERYIAPMYNAMIRDGRSVAYDLISAQDVVFCGVPKEYDEFRSSPEKAAKIINGIL